MRGSPGSAEGGNGHYIHLLHVDLQDVGRRQETSREDHTELLLAKSPARGVTGGGARRVDYRVPSRVTRRARPTSPSPYQHGPSYQVGVLADATFRRLNICGATRRVRILVGLGDLADPEARRLCIFIERTAEFPASIEVLSPSVGGRGDLPVLG